MKFWWLISLIIICSDLRFPMGDVRPEWEWRNISIYDKALSKLFTLNLYCFEEIAVLSVQWDISSTKKSLLKLFIQVSKHSKFENLTSDLRIQFFNHKKRSWESWVFQPNTKTTLFKGGESHLLNTKTGRMAGRKAEAWKIINFHHHHYTSVPFSIFYCIIKDSANFFHFIDDGRKWSEEKEGERIKPKKCTVYTERVQNLLFQFLSWITVERVTCFRKQIYWLIRLI